MRGLHGRLTCKSGSVKVPPACYLSLESDFPSLIHVSPEVYWPLSLGLPWIDQSSSRGAQARREFKPRDFRGRFTSLAGRRKGILILSR